MTQATFDELLEAGVHFGHLKRKWNPKMAPYIFMERNGIHVIDLQKTAVKLNEALSALKQIAKSGKNILFVATKKQAKEIVAEKVKPTGMPYVTERWPGGMLTNFPTIKRTIKKMATIDERFADGTYDKLAKRERLQIQRQRAKLEKTFGSISNMSRPPAAIFIVDVTKEHIAVREAQRLNIPIFAMVDTNSNPQNVDFPIPANDDASKSISYIIGKVTEAIMEGQEEQKMEKEKEAGEAKEKKATGKESKGKEKPAEKKKTRARKASKARKSSAKTEETGQQKSGESTEAASESPEGGEATEVSSENAEAGGSESKQAENKQTEQAEEPKNNQSEENNQ
ncbi:MAG: 30S ribosomal protein S2 [Bacteroidales bacterium]|nr:30S ribosomal protein S2 [Bacteroidales bacterium]